MSSMNNSGLSAWNEDRPQDNTHSSDSSDSDDDEEAVPVETESGETQFNHYEFARKISTNKRLDKSRCLKEGYLQILRSTSFHKWRRRYFWLKGKTLFYGKNSQALMYEEIDIAQASVAEYTLKNVNHAFQVIAKFGNFVLATDSRKEMESWIQSIIHASQQKYYDRNDQQSMILGLHSWYIASHARPIHCNVCKEALPGVLSRGLSCGVCRFKSHKRCAVHAPNNCKWSTLASVGSNIIEHSDGSLDTGHQWIVGNLPVGTNNNCSVCEKKCGSIWKLVDERCLWCKAIVHTACKDKFPTKCNKVVCQFSVLCPVSIQSIDSNGLCQATKCRGAVTSPLLVFVNSKSGDKQGVKFLRKFKQLLNPAQVFDLMNGGPFPGLRLFENYDHFRILICGGDGSIGWVMSEMDHLNLHHKCQVGVLPLGTGNDLARVLGWGAVMSDDNQVTSVIDKLEQSQIKMLDRWSIQTYEWKQPRFRLPSDEEVEQVEVTIGTSPSANSLLQQDPGNGKKKEETTPENSPTQSTFESTIAVCLHKILNSNDYLTIIDYSKSLCEIVTRFLDKLLSLEQLNSSAGCDKVKCNDSPLDKKCETLKAKLNKLVEALSETKVLADQEEMKQESSSHMTTSTGNQSQSLAESTNPLTPDVETGENTEILMCRANSVKKAIKQIMDHTEAAMNLTICPNMMSLVELQPVTPAQPDQQSDTSFLQSGANKPNTAPNKGKQSNKSTSQPHPNVSFAVRSAEGSRSSDHLSTPSTDLLSPNRKISAVSMFSGSADSGSSGLTATSNQSAPRPSTSLRVKNAIANKREGCGSFISKMLLANADAICAPVIPPIDDQAFLSEFEEKAVMNNYFGIGLDAKINYEFQEQREHHPERFRSRARNFMTFASLGGKEIVLRSCRNFEKRIRLECDGQQLPLPELQGIVILNIPSYSGGTNFWGTHNSGSSEPFTAPSFDDKIIEVMAVKGSAHIGASRFINIDYHRIAQCRSVKLTILGSDPVPVQVDGEAWLQNPGFIKITHKNRAQMLTRDRSFEHTLKSWSERQLKEKLAVNLPPHSPERGARRFSAEESRMHDLVQATHELIDCLSVMNLGNTARSNIALSKCGEFITLDDATRAGLQELSLCSTELCSEVQELLETHSTQPGTSETDDSIAKLRSALHQTQSKLESFTSRPNHSPPTPHKHRHGPFGIIGRLIGRHKRSSTNSNKNSPGTSTAENIINLWTIEDVGSWLGNVGLGEYSHLFIKNDIRGSELLQLQQQDFKDLGITKVGHIKRIQSALKSYSLSKDP